jgi:hypothetical protein
LLRSQCLIGRTLPLYFIALPPSIFAPQPDNRLAGAFASLSHCLHCLPSEFAGLFEQSPRLLNAGFQASLCLSRHPLAGSLCSSCKAIGLQETLSATNTLANLFAHRLHLASDGLVSPCPQFGEL